MEQRIFRPASELVILLAQSLLPQAAQQEGKLSRGARTRQGKNIPAVDFAIFLLVASHETSDHLVWVKSANRPPLLFQSRGRSAGVYFDSLHFHVSDLIHLPKQEGLLIMGGEPVCRPLDFDRHRIFEGNDIFLIFADQRRTSSYSCDSFSRPTSFVVCT